VQEAVQQVRPPFVADAEAPAAQQPGEAALDHPSMPPQPLAGVDASSGNSRHNAASTQRATLFGRIVRLVGMEFGRALPGPARFPPRADDGRDGVDQGQQLGRIVGVGRRQADGTWDTIAIDDQVVLGTRFPAVGRVGPRLDAPLFARMLTESTLALVQSIAAS
jgi:hypothetical protein